MNTQALISTTLIVFAAILLQGCGCANCPEFGSVRINLVHGLHELNSGASPSTMYLRVNTASPTPSIGYKGVLTTPTTAGPTGVQVFAPGIHNEPVASYNGVLGEYDHLTIFAVGPIAGTSIAPTISVSQAVPQANVAKIRFANMVTDAPALTLRSTLPLATLHSDVASRAVTGYSEFTPATFSLQVDGAGGSPTVQFAPYAFETARVYTVVAFGTIDPTDATPLAVRVYTESDPAGTIAELTPVYPGGTSHLMVVQSSPNAPALNVLVNTTQANVEMLEFPRSFGYHAVSVASGAPTVSFKTTTVGMLPIVPPTASQPAFLPNMYYSMFSVGSWTTSASAYITVADQFQSSITTPQLRIANMTSDAGELDVLIGEGAVQSDLLSITNVGARSVSPFVLRPAGTYNVQIVRIGTSTVLHSMSGVVLAPGKVLTLHVHGYGDGKLPGIGANMISHQ
jgi:hypothetical protein